ncbi:GMC family oxidoreductase [Devosia sp. YIM 151766]|uniref:FAD-dependent oxidoreductase n=1 Tax=Devosia sp. YIM 151766 TaxID=3017325 RepID=UPI00255CC87F|nr:GMC family oxidoreductase [Devosia sp. YIM 151766]WIY54214.1 GMC family oxidoreductase [Devosia sp. YIM 151766]
MPIRDLLSAPEQVTRVAAEFCVIGGGMAGLFIARRLAEAGRSVVVLESGKDGFEQETHDLNRIVDVQGRYSRAMDGRYRGLGGSSSRWGGRLVPIYAEDTAARPHLGLAGWPLAYEELQRYQARVEDVFGVTHSPFGKEALEVSGLNAAFRPDDPDFDGRLAKWIRFRRCNLATIWRSELERLSGLEIWLGATVTNFELDRANGILRGVEARSLGGKSTFVTADHFVVAAGTIETTRLLLWLERQSDGYAFARSNVLGRYFQDHLKAEVATIERRDQAEGNLLFGYHFVDGTRRSLHLDFTTAAQRESGAPSAFAYAAMDLSASKLAHIKTMARGLQRGRVDLRELFALAPELPLVAKSLYWRLLRRQVYMPADVRLGLQIAIEQAPHRDNRIVLASETDAMGMPMAAVNWRPRASDEATFRTVARRLQSYWKRAGLEKDFPLDWRVAETDGDMAFTDLADAYAHPSGSTRMGTDPTESVVGPDLVCHDVPNLSVASAAVFPTAGSANPTLTILELALRHADSLLATRRGQAVVSLRDQASSTVLTEAMAPLSASATRATSSSSI